MAAQYRDSTAYAAWLFAKTCHEKPPYQFGMRTILLGVVIWALLCSFLTVVWWRNRIESRPVPPPVRIADLWRLALNYPRYAIAIREASAELDGPDQNLPLKSHYQWLCACARDAGRLQVIMAIRSRPPGVATPGESE